MQRLQIHYPLSLFFEWIIKMNMLIKIAHKGVVFINNAICSALIYCSPQYLSIYFTYVPKTILYPSNLNIWKFVKWGNRFLEIKTIRAIIKPATPVRHAIRPINVVWFSKSLFKGVENENSSWTSRQSNIVSIISKNVLTKRRNQPFNLLNQYFWHPLYKKLIFYIYRIRFLSQNKQFYNKNHTVQKEIL